MHIVGIGCTGPELPAARDGDKVEAAALCFELGADAFEERLDALRLNHHLFDRPNHFGEFDQREGALGGEEDSLEHGAEV
jgi:hypothetical protein